MARSATVFSCSSACGHESPKWHGRCPGCGEWNTLVEEARAAPPARGGAGAGGRRSARALKPVALADVQAPAVERLSTGIGELDRVLGGGLVPGSLVLIGGSPGIGKSTLTSGALGHLAAGGRRVLYVSGEESAAQVKLRAERLGRAALTRPDRRRDGPRSRAGDARGGAPRGLRDRLRAGALRPRPDRRARGRWARCARSPGRIMRVAKELDIATLLVGHVTKEGSLAGPRVLEHLVDCVLSFEGERERTYRTLRALKNRFGSTNEVGVFEMAERGPGRGRGRLAALRERGHARAGLGRAVRDGGLAAAAGGGPGAGGAQRAGAAAAGRQRRRPQPACAGAGGAGAPRRDRAGFQRRVRVGRRRCARGRAGRRPRDRAGARLRRQGRRADRRTSRSRRSASWA